jgi:hypothetical protein
MKFIQIILIFFLGLILFGCNLPENKKTTKKHLEILEQYYRTNETYFLEIPAGWDTIYNVGSITLINPSAYSCDFGH